jgi:hypothetical protein
VVLANLVASKEVLGGGVKAKSSQVLDMFLKEFPIAYFIFIPYAWENFVLLSPM